jgi:hydroxymethylpyrimidine pyrophosphatase-like HAD family hydrolase
MGNASSFATAAADEVIGSNAEDAVAVFIESLLARN